MEETTADKVWLAAKEACEQLIGYATANAALGGAEVVGMENGVLSVQVLSQVARDLLGEWTVRVVAKLRDEKGWTNLAGLKFRTAEKTTVPFTQAPVSAVAEERQQPRLILPEAPQLNPGYTFERTVVGDWNRLAIYVGRQICKCPGGEYNPLYIHGKSGTGKTWIVQAIGNEVLVKHPGLVVVYVSAERFTNELIEAIKGGKTEEFRRRYRYVNVWLVEEIQFFTDGKDVKEATLQEFYHTVNTLLSGAQVVFTADRAPNKLGIEDPRLCSRLQAGVVECLGTPSRDDIARVLTSRREEMGCELATDVSGYLADYAIPNLRVPLGALTKIHAMQEVIGHPVSLEEVKQALESYSGVGSRVVSMGAIIGHIVNTRHVDAKTLRAGKNDKAKRNKAEILARHCAIYLCRVLTDHTLTEIADFFGRCDHSTISHSVRFVTDLMSKDETTRWLIDDMTTAIKEEGM